MSALYFSPTRIAGFYSDSSLILQSSTDRHVAPLGQQIYMSLQSGNR